MSLVRLCVCSVLAAAIWLAASVPVLAIEKYQFMKATENRVWRLNKESGEIAVCTLQGERLICTTSTEAAAPPPKSYAEIKAAEKARQEKQQDKDLAILERILAFFREMITITKGEKAAQ